MAWLKENIMKYYCGDKWHECEVIGCDVDFGISIVIKGTNKFALCLNSTENLIYKRLFYLIEAKIKNGAVTNTAINDMFVLVTAGKKYRNDKSPSETDCPFNEGE